MDEYNITDAKCERCGEEVEPMANIGHGWQPKQGTRTLSNHIYTYWSCQKCGATQAKLTGKYGGEIISNSPSDLFDNLLIKTR